MSTAVDLSNIANVFLSLASAAVLAAIPIVVPYLLKRLKIGADADMAAKVDAVATDAAGAAYNYALQHEGGLKSVPITNAGIAEGAALMNAKVGPEMESLGITPALVTATVQAKLGTLLAGDPSVSAGAPVATPAPSPVVQPTK